MANILCRYCKTVLGDNNGFLDDNDRDYICDGEECVAQFDLDRYTPPEIPPDTIEEPIIEDYQPPEK